MLQEAHAQGLGSLSSLLAVVDGGIVLYNIRKTIASPDSLDSAPGIEEWPLGNLIKVNGSSDAFASSSGLRGVKSNERCSTSNPDAAPERNT